MANNVEVTAGTGTTFKTTDTAGVHTGHVNVDSIAAGDNNIGNVDIVTVPADPFGADADAASVTGSISAKLRAMATAIGTAVLTRNSGAADAGTLRVTIDTGQIGAAGQAVPASSVSVVGADWEIETVAASQTDQALGATGATGDYLHEILVVPETTSPGSIVLEDNGAGAITLFTGGASSVATLHPFIIPVGWKSTAGAFSLTTGANVHLVAKGVFT